MELQSAIVQFLTTRTIWPVGVRTKFMLLVDCGSDKRRRAHITCMSGGGWLWQCHGQVLLTPAVEELRMEELE